MNEPFWGALRPICGKPMSGLRNTSYQGSIMKLPILTVLFAAALGLSAPSIALSAPTTNSDGSKTCNASGPGNAGEGVCPNTLEQNEAYCTGGMSTEEGGGTTCAEAPTSQSRSTGPKGLKKN
jgi:hypothetical protein